MIKKLVLSASVLGAMFGTFALTGPANAEVVIYDESTDGDLPDFPSLSNNASLGTLDLEGAVITGTLIGDDRRDSIVFYSPNPFRVIVDSFSGSAVGVQAFGFGEAFGSFDGVDIGRAEFEPGVLYDGVGNNDSGQFAPYGILPAGEYRFDFGPDIDIGELTAYQVTIVEVPQ